MGGCSTAAVALGMSRRFVGFELSKPTFASRVPRMADVVPGALLPTLRMPTQHAIANAGQAWSDQEIDALVARFGALAKGGKGKGEIVADLCEEFGRGYWAITKLLKKLNGRLPALVARRGRRALRSPRRF
jgi:hypothetical protein